MESTPTLTPPAAQGVPAPAAGRAPAAAWTRTAPEPERAELANGPRLAELFGALSLALDMSQGQPAGHAQRACWIGQQLGRALGLTAHPLRELYYATLLKDVGCTANAARVSALFLADDLRFKCALRTARRDLPGQLHFTLSHTGRGAPLARRLRAVLHVLGHGADIAHELIGARAQRGAQVARQLGFGDGVAEAIAALDEHWDGSGEPEGLAGEEIPLLARIAQLAQVADAFHAAAGPRAAREAVARRRGRELDPRLCDLFAGLALDPGFWLALGADDLEQRLHEIEPAREPQPLAEDELDDIAAVFGQVVDAKSPWNAGHSARVARTAERIAQGLGLEAGPCRWLRRGALLHDLGKLGVPNTVLDKPAPLDPRERAAMQRHAGYTEHLLGRIPSFGALARVISAHHEKLDGSGYPRGLDARHIRLETRIITTADVFDALTSDRSWRAARPIEAALAALQAEVGRTIDGDCLAALRRALATSPG